MIDQPDMMMILSMKIRRSYNELKSLRDFMSTLSSEHARDKSKEVDGAMAVLSSWAEALKYGTDDLVTDHLFNNTTIKIEHVEE